MTRSYTTLYPGHIVILTIILLLYCPSLSADREGLTDDGREVLLKEDGSWEFRSSDRYANTRDGQRVRLKPDNTWEYVGNSPLVNSTQVRTRLLDITLSKGQFEIHKQKVQKNIRKTTQTVFYLDIHVSPAAETSLRIDSKDLARILVTDDKGKIYTILATTPSPTELPPDTKHRITVRANGAPSKWDGAKSMSISFAPGFLGIEKSIRLNMNISDMDKKNVDNFD